MMRGKRGLIVGSMWLVLLAAACTKSVQSGNGNTEQKTVITTQASQEGSNRNNPSFELSRKEYIQNDFIIYYVNCAAENVSGVADGDFMGLYQTVTDQSYGIDPGTGVTWGYQEKPYMEAEGDLSSLDKTSAKWRIKEGIGIIPHETGFYYDFTLPPGEYQITCGFYNPFSARLVSIKAEDMVMVRDQKILKYKLSEAVFTREVTDGELNLLVYNPTNGDEIMREPILSYILIRLVPEYDRYLLEALMAVAAISKEQLGQCTASSIESYSKAYAEAGAVLEKEEAGFNEYKESYILLKEAYDNMIKKPVYTAFRPGEEWRDTENNVIQAHGGQVQRLTVRDRITGSPVEKWWWVGEDKTKGNRGGICAYSSEDLYNWTFEGIVMRNVSSRDQLEEEEYFSELYGDYTSEQLDRVYTCINDTLSIIERPKMIYNEKTGKYIIWFHADGPTSTSNSSYAAASAGVAICDTPYGPFKFIDRYRLNTCPEDQEDQYPASKGMARDMNLFVDDDGTAYIIYSSEENLTLYISKLNDTYTYLAADPEKAVYGVDFIRLFPGAQREAPAMFKKDGRYYMMTSGCTGWAPNPSKMFMADSILADWTDMGDPCVGDTQRTTFDSQSTCIFLADKESQTYIYMGDRWFSEDLANSRYVWLPVDFDKEGNAFISFVEEWTLPVQNEE
ncbi:hypothetical protein HNQ56_004823 [Anaerotaenia torta]|uniref:glycoside hydrolase family 43 protein n=1 Tax=Anaerotaenia torta TaxID=433293 RepID=UPI003D1D98DF